MHIPREELTPPKEHLSAYPPQQYPEMIRYIIVQRILGGQDQTLGEEY